MQTELHNRGDYLLRKNISKWKPAGFTSYGHGGNKNESSRNKCNNYKLCSI